MCGLCTNLTKIFQREVSQKPQKETRNPHKHCKAHNFCVFLCIIFLDCVTPFENNRLIGRNAGVRSCSKSLEITQKYILSIFSKLHIASFGYMIARKTIDKPSTRKVVSPLCFLALAGIKTKANYTHFAVLKDIRLFSAHKINFQQSL